MFQQILAQSSNSQRPHKRIEAFWKKKMTEFVAQPFQRNSGRAAVSVACQKTFCTGPDPVSLGLILKKASLAATKQPTLALG
jgi:hypothetical protein